MNPSTPGLLCDLGRVTEAWSSISWVGTPSFPQSHGGREMVGSPTAAWCTVGFPERSLLLSFVCCKFAIIGHCTGDF